MLQIEEENRLSIICNLEVEWLPGQHMRTSASFHQNCSLPPLKINQLKAWIGLDNELVFLNEFNAVDLVGACEAIDDFYRFRQKIQNRVAKLILVLPHN